MGFWVGDWLVEPTLSRIRRGDLKVHVEPRSIEVLECLAGRPGQVLSKEHLIRSVWEDSFVSDEVLTHAIWELRKALGDDARAPTYIQTIPKKGYRLVAEVRPVAPDRPAEKSGRWLHSRWLWLGGVVFGLLILLIRTGAITKPGDPPAVPDGFSGAGTPRLVVSKPVDQDTHTTLLAAVYRELRQELTGIRGLSLVDVDGRPIEDWSRAPDRFDRSLELELLSGGDAIGCSLRGLVPEEPAYGWRIPVTDSTPPQQIAEQVRNRVAAFARVNELPQAHDPDLQPWFSLRTHALEAVRAFLEGIPYTLRFEEGSTRYYAKAAAIDPSFPAPLIWLTRSLLGTRAELATHRDRLAAARETASPFEKALIDMALALALPEPNWPEMQKHLEVALLYEPGNGPVLVVLAMAQSFNGNLDEALDTLSPLVERSWRYPSIYPQAAEYAIKLDRIERAKEILTIGLDVGAAAGAEPTLLDTWILLEALALFEGDTAAAERARLGLERRRGELPPDQVRILTGQALLHLTDRATEAGRPESGEAISRLLEEFSEKTD